MTSLNWTVIFAFLAAVNGAEAASQLPVKVPKEASPEETSASGFIQILMDVSTVPAQFVSQMDDDHLALWIVESNSLLDSSPTLPIFKSVTSRRRVKEVVSAVFGPGLTVYRHTLDSKLIDWTPRLSLKPGHRHLCTPPSSTTSAGSIDPTPVDPDGLAVFITTQIDSIYWPLLRSICRKVKVHIDGRSRNLLVHGTGDHGVLLLHPSINGRTALFWAINTALYIQKLAQKGDKDEIIASSRRFCMLYNAFPDGLPRRLSRWVDRHLPSDNARAIARLLHLLHEMQIGNHEAISNPMRFLLPETSDKERKIQAQESDRLSQLVMAGTVAVAAVYVQLVINIGLWACSPILILCLLLIGYLGLNDE